MTTKEEIIYHILDGYTKYIDIMLDKNIPQSEKDKVSLKALSTWKPLFEEYKKRLENAINLEEDK